MENLWPLRSPPQKSEGACLFSFIQYRAQSLRTIRNKIKRKERSQIIPFYRWHDARLK